jgi:hypothetical protein
VELFLISVINYLIPLKDIYLVHKSYEPAYIKQYIEGELLNFDLIKKEFSINEGALISLLDKIGVIVLIFSKLLQIKNSEWLEEYFKLNKNYLQENVSTERQNIVNENKRIKSNKKVGRIGMFTSENEIHKKLQTISNWKTLSRTELAKKLGYKSSSGLNELLKSKNWKLPE